MIHKTLTALFRSIAMLAVLVVDAPLENNLLGQDEPNGRSAPRTDVTGPVNPVHSEVELGEFIVPVRFADTNSTVTIFTKLFVTVRINEQDGFERQLETRQARLRDKVLVALRGTSREDLYRRNLTEIKDRLHEAILSAIESPGIYRVGFVSFYYSEE